MQITVIVNDIATNINQNDSIVTLLELLKQKTEGIALAVNQTIIPKENWSNHLLQNNDNIIIFQAIAGG